ncbi:hypothetical protein V6Z12_D01G043100 [Gossypium hirsutum]
MKVFFLFSAVSFFEEQKKKIKGLPLSLLGFPSVALKPKCQTTARHGDSSRTAPDVARSRAFKPVSQVSGRSASFPTKKRRERSLSFFNLRPWRWRSALRKSGHRASPVF